MCQQESSRSQQTFLKNTNNTTSNVFSKNWIYFTPLSLNISPENIQLTLSSLSVTESDMFLYNTEFQQFILHSVSSIKELSSTIRA